MAKRRNRQPSRRHAEGQKGKQRAGKGSRGEGKLKGRRQSKGQEGGTYLKPSGEEAQPTTKRCCTLSKEW